MDKEHIDALIERMDSLHEYIGAVNGRIDALNEYIDAQDGLLGIRQDITLDALLVTRDMFKLLENPTAEGLFEKFVEKRNDLDIKLDALREEE